MAMHPERRNGLTRRRFIRVTAMGALGCMAGPVYGVGLTPAIWRGRAMGTDAAITLFHPEPRAAAHLLARCQTLIGDLESQLSLYQPDSALCRLNRDGVLDTAPRALLEILRLAYIIHQQTDGAFDVTVQPLWRLYSDHFARAGADPSGPSDAKIAAAAACVDARAIHIQDDKIHFAKPGMAVTLNGIAQGYITDQVAALLHAAGMENVLLDLGEFRALGPHPAGRAWQIGIRDPLASWRMMDRVPLRQGAIATSGGYGTQFDASGRFHHLFDPASGQPARHYRSLTIHGPDAARADALSTGLSALPLPQAKKMLDWLGTDWGGYFVTSDGGVHRHHWPAG
ncbi:MAG: FAD:protein FMN transferase [Alphaproteobacteria bacterium]|nr:FAD:protein FMN transferase [Alphaproteobacteria bacterium]